MGTVAPCVGEAPGGAGEGTLAPQSRLIFALVIPGSLGQDLVQVHVMAAV